MATRGTGGFVASPATSLVVFLVSVSVVFSSSSSSSTSPSFSSSASHLEIHAQPVVKGLTSLDVFLVVVSVVFLIVFLVAVSVFFLVVSAVAFSECFLVDVPVALIVFLDIAVFGTIPRVGLSFFVPLKFEPLVGWALL